jgi:cytochrome c biogenesis protein CcdA
MSMLNTHGAMPTSAYAAGTTAALTTSATAQGTLSSALYWLGVTLLILTAVFALAAVRSLLPSRRRTS